MLTGLESSSLPAGLYTAHLTAWKGGGRTLSRVARRDDGGNGNSNTDSSSEGKRARRAVERESSGYVTDSRCEEWALALSHRWKPWGTMTLHRVCIALRVGWTVDADPNVGWSLEVQIFKEQWLSPPSSLCAARRAPHAFAFSSGQGQCGQPVLLEESWDPHTETGRQGWLAGVSARAIAKHDFVRNFRLPGAGLRCSKPPCGT